MAGGTETVAVLQPGTTDQYKLYGYKFFSSATDADVALTLARIADPATGKTKPGTQGLSLFCLLVDQPKNLQVMRLKQKLGTKQLPTGELLLDGIEAQLISAPGRGVASISPMLSITRLHNAVASVASMRRFLFESRFRYYDGLFMMHVLIIRNMARLGSLVWREISVTDVWLLAKPSRTIHYTCAPWPKWN